MRIGAFYQQMRDAMRQRIGLARPRARDHEQRPGGGIRRVGAELDGLALRVVELR